MNTFTLLFTHRLHPPPPRQFGSLLPQLEKAAISRGVATAVVVSSAAHFDSYPEGILPSIERMNDESTYDRAKA